MRNSLKFYFDFGEDSLCVCVRCPADKQYKEGWKGVCRHFKIATVHHEKELKEKIGGVKSILIFIAWPSLIRRW